MAKCEDLEIVERLGEMAERFCTTLDCAGVGFVHVGFVHVGFVHVGFVHDGFVPDGFVPDGFLDELPRPGVLGTTRVGGVSLDSRRTRSALAAVAALAVAPKGFTVAELASKAQHPSGQGLDSCSTRQAAYDLRKLRAKGLVEKPGRTRRYHVPPDALRTIPAVTTIRERVLAVNGHCSAKWGSLDASLTAAIGRWSSATTKTCARACKACSATSASG